MIRPPYAIECPKCSSIDTHVRDTKGITTKVPEVGVKISPPVRTRRCRACDARWQTVEIELSTLSEIQRLAAASVLATMARSNGVAMADILSALMATEGEQ